jgi:putative ABC transport system permease protein
MEIRPILSALARSKTGAVLVAVQVALSLAILANALYIVEVRQALAARPSGVADEASVAYLNVYNLKTGTQQDQIAAQQAQIATLRSVPSVVSAALTNQIPLSQSGWNSSVQTSLAEGASSQTASIYISPDSLVKTWGLKLIEGRDITPADVEEIDTATSKKRPERAIISKALAQNLWPEASSYAGKTLYFGSGVNADGVRVLGVVERLQSHSAQVTPRGEYGMIAAARMTGDPTATFTLRAEAGQRDRVLRDAEAALHAAAITPIIVESRTLEQDRAQRYRADRALSWMLIAISALLLIVTASGIVGIASLWVSQRRKQIGVRRALGARRIDILRYFLTENFMITSAGIAAGVLLALGLNQLLVSKLELTRLPYQYLAGGAGLFWLLGVAAVYGPAWRAASISPATATRAT